MTIEILTDPLRYFSIQLYDISLQKKKKRKFIHFGFNGILTC